MSNAQQLSSVSSIPLVYTAQGGGMPAPGWRYELASDGVRAITDTLRGKASRVDTRMQLFYLSQFDVEAGCPVGPEKPLVVFLYTDMAIPGVPSARQYNGQSGVYVCKRNLADVFSDDPSILWVNSKAHIKHISKSEDVILETAKLVSATLLNASKFRRVFGRVVQWIHAVLGVLV